MEVAVEPIIFNSSLTGDHLFYVSNHEAELELKLKYDRKINKLVIKFCKFIQCPNKVKSKYKNFSLILPNGFSKSDVEYALRQKDFKYAYYLD